MRELLQRQTFLLFVALGLHRPQLGVIVELILDDIPVLLGRQAALKSRASMDTRFPARSWMFAAR